MRRFTDATRLHFDAQDFMESGTPGVKSTEDGFLSRAVGLKKDPKTSPLRAGGVLSGAAAHSLRLRWRCGMTNLGQFGIRAERNISGRFRIR